MKPTKDVYKILAEWFPEGNFSEEDFWEAVAEADGYQRDYYADGDIAEWL
mgnify:CR=1 FL=1